MKRFLIVIALLLATAGVNLGLSQPQGRISCRPLEEFPEAIGEWRMVGEHRMDDGSMAVLRVDDYIMRNYVNGQGEVLGLYIGYFKTQREGKQVHSPRQCLPGAGWSIVESREYVLPLKGERNGGAPVNLYVMGKGAERHLYLWWYQGRGRIYASEYWNKMYLILDGITKNRTDGALVRVNMLVNPDVETTLKKEVDFVHLLLPEISKFIPN